MRLLFCAGLLSPSITGAVVGQAFVVHIMIARCPSATIIRKLGNKGLLFIGPGSCTASLEPCSKVSGRERVSEREHRPGSLLLVGLRGEGRVLRVYSLLVNIKYKSWDLKGGKRKKPRGPNGQLSKSDKISKTKEAGRWGAGSGSSPAAPLCVRRGLLAVDASIIKT